MCILKICRYRQPSTLIPLSRYKLPGNKVLLHAFFWLSGLKGKKIEIFTVHSDSIVIAYKKFLRRWGIGSLDFNDFHIRGDRIFYNHQTVSHNETFKDPVTGPPTNTIKGTSNALKYQLPLRKSTNYLDENGDMIDNLDDHLGEFKWRRNPSEIYREDSFEPIKKL
ncbi:hypothetical protein RF11_00773 [Thelohanellus kitauei]|uniref:Uncharacterized protein n=1 Tax=Thelohanellus kitauei TaxID=669202 RepID=A0A0C2JPR6_THEKT|nr:hypothetical protein RF11_00773 [Thelohanellus kitauei]